MIGCNGVGDDTVVGFAVKIKRRRSQWGKKEENGASFQCKNNTPIVLCFSYTVGPVLADFGRFLRRAAATQNIFRMGCA